MGSDEGPSDEDLLAAHITGDPHAFAALLHRHGPYLSHLARITSCNHDDAEDALQDAMFSAHRNATRFRRDSSVSSWLYRIVVNACLDRRRRNSFQIPTEFTDDPHVGGDPTSWIDTALVVERALQELPEEQRAAVVAVDMDGYSVAEAAQLLGVPEGTVKSRRSRARAKLARALATHTP